MLHVYAKVFTYKCVIYINNFSKKNLNNHSNNIEHFIKLLMKYLTQ